MKIALSAPVNVSDMVPTEATLVWLGSNPTGGVPDARLEIGSVVGATLRILLQTPEEKRNVPRRAPSYRNHVQNMVWSCWTHGIPMPFKSGFHQFPRVVHIRCGVRAHDAAESDEGCQDWSPENQLHG